MAADLLIHSHSADSINQTKLKSDCWRQQLIEIELIDEAEWNAIK